MSQKCATKKIIASAFSLFIGLATWSQSKLDFFLNEGELYNNPIYVASKQLLISTPPTINGGDVEANRVTIWDLKAASVLKNIFLGNNNLKDIRLSPAEKYLIFNGDDSTRILDLNTIEWVFSYKNDEVYYFNQAFFNPHFFKNDSIFLFHSNEEFYYVNTRNWKHSKLFRTEVNISLADITLDVYFSNSAIGILQDDHMKLIDVPEGKVIRDVDLNRFDDKEFSWAKFLPFDNLNKLLMYSNEGKTTKFKVVNMRQQFVSSTVTVNFGIDILKSDAVLPSGNSFLVFANRYDSKGESFKGGYRFGKIDYTAESLTASEFQFDKVKQLSNFYEGLLKFNNYTAALIDNEAGTINTVNFRSGRSFSFKSSDELGQLTLLDSNLVAYATDPFFDSKSKFRIFNAIDGKQTIIEPAPYTISGISKDATFNLICKSDSGNYMLTKIQDDFSVKKYMPLNTNVKKIRINPLKLSLNKLWLQLEVETNRLNSFKLPQYGIPQMANLLSIHLPTAATSPSVAPQEDINNFAGSDCFYTFTIDSTSIWPRIDSVFIKDSKNEKLIASVDFDSVSSTFTGHSDLKFYYNSAHDKLLFQDVWGFGIFELKQGSISKKYHVQCSGIQNVSFCNNEKNICAWSGGSISFYNASNGELLNNNKRNVEGARYFIPNKYNTKFLACYSGYVSGRIELHDFSDSQSLNIIERQNKKWIGNDIHAGMGNDLFYTFENTGNLFIYRIEDCKLLHSKKIGSTFNFNAQFLGDTALLYFDLKGVPTIWNFALKTESVFKSFSEIGTIQNFALIPESNLLVSTSYNNLYFWNLRERILEIRLIVGDTADFLLIDRNGFYTGSKSIYPKIRARFKNDVFSPVQMDVLYNRPDKVLQTLGSAFGSIDNILIENYKRAWQKRTKKLAINSTQFNAAFSVPKADFVNRNAIPHMQTSTDGVLELLISGVDSTCTLDRYNVWVNDVPIFGQKGINIRSDSSNTFEQRVYVHLSEGENKIETAALNVNGMESFRIPLFVNLTLKEKNIGKYYFIGIGIDKYHQAGYDLDYSAKDIRDLAKALKQKHESNISIDTLFNEQVNRKNIRFLKEKLLNSEVNDKVIISFSGHGLLDKKFDYYLATHTIDFDNPAIDGLPYEDLEWLLDSIPARKKLLLIDACHSGEVDKEELMAMNSVLPEGTRGLKLAYDYKPNLGMKNSFELMQELFANVNRGTGATVISAAGGTQYARESGTLKNGVFTYSILELMQQKQSITVSELKEKVGKRVEELTNGLQKPTSRTENIEFDWRVW